MGARRDRLVEAARGLGFARVGATPLGPVARAEFVAAWLAEGRAAEMTYLGRRQAERLDPRRAFPWARTIISLAVPYPPLPAPTFDWRHELRGRIAAYAVGRDYHEHLLESATTLGNRLRLDFPGHRFLAYVDTGPILERDWARRAGLGWIGKHTLVLDAALGSYTLLAELVTDLEIEEPGDEPADHCGTCTRCLAACPTGALTPYVMDPRRCLSYLTIEHRSAIPHAFRPALENWIFGCDLCQSACPWNTGPPAPADLREAAFPSLPELLRLTPEGFTVRFGQTALAWARRAGLLRNVAVALGNSGNPEAVPPLIEALDDPEPLVRGHAAWALGRLGGTAARTALLRARPAESDPGALAEIDLALD